jgi:hypothetical protein
MFIFTCFSYHIHEFVYLSHLLLSMPLSYIGFLKHARLFPSTSHALINIISEYSLTYCCNNTSAIQYEPGMVLEYL